MNKIFFIKKTEMTAFAERSGLEYVRCKQRCLHYPFPTRTAILLINPDETINSRLVRCKVCAITTGNYNEMSEQSGQHREKGEGGNNV